MITSAIVLALIHSPQLIAAGLAVFVLPGAVLVAALRLETRVEERLAWWFAASLVLLTVTFAACVGIGVSIEAAPGVLAVVTIVAAVVGRRFGGAPGETLDRAEKLRPTVGHYILVVTAAASVAAAVEFAPVGSIDRWWYLAYVRGYLDAAQLSLAEPFLGTGQAFARFGFHPWLLGLAMWSSLSGVDPVEVYERAAPVLAVLAAVTATISLAIELFGRTVRARLTILTTILLWSGGLVPVLARAGEDKILAAAALLPLCIAAFLRVLRENRAATQRAGLLLLGIATVATAAVHALAYAFVLVALLPFAAVIAWSSPEKRRAAALATVLLVGVAVAPAVSGFVVTERLGDIGADLAHDDHPVVRVHEARDRLVEIPFAGFVVNPHLLAHPLGLLALVGLLVASGRARDDAERFLLTTTLVPLAIAFLPPLPALAGSVIPPWMVYRVLWLVPLAPLAALAVEEFVARYTWRETMATLLVLALGLPMVASGTRSRLAEVRERLAAPTTEDFTKAMLAVASLPKDALVVAAPELSERIPALTARHVAAALDRSTIVFTGSRERGEARLRARAALLAGDIDGSELARAAGIAPTHAVYDPRELPAPRCDHDIHRGEAWAVCELQHVAAQFTPPSLASTDAHGTSVMAEAECGPARTPGRKRNPWNAAPPLARCSATLPSTAPALLRIEAETGRAADELRIDVRDSGGRAYRGTARVDCCGNAGIELPPLVEGPLQIRIASSFLPAVRPIRVTIAAR